MMQKLIILVLLVTSIGCASIPSGYYANSCQLYGDPSSLILFKSDSTFRFKRVLWEFEIEGKWEVRGDTVILNSIGYSSILANEPESLKKQLTSFKEGSDHFIQENNTLRGITKEGDFESCFQYRVKSSKKGKVLWESLYSFDN